MRYRYEVIKVRHDGEVPVPDGWRIHSIESMQVSTGRLFVLLEKIER